MKVSLRWIFDHIHAPYSSDTADHIVTLFNQKTAEVEHTHSIKWDMDIYALATIEHCIGADEVSCLIPEYGKKVILPMRALASQGSSSGVTAYLVTCVQEEWRWATLHDFGVEKEGMLPGIQVAPELLHGSWRMLVEADDVILEVDNKSLTHRPDMWGHRGFAREIAAFLELPFKEESEFLKALPTQLEQEGSVLCNGWTIENQAPAACSALVGATLSQVSVQPSLLPLLFRLLKIGYRPLNSVIDITNYVMADWGHPMHAYDASCINEKTLCARWAEYEEHLVTLDESECILTTDDLIIADTHKPLALAGIMGGKHDSVQKDTTTLFIEAGCFDAATLRRAAQRHKLRTESSQRGEKTLDPHSAIQALQRFISLSEKYRLGYVLTTPLFGVLKPIPPRRLTITHDVIEKKVGITISSEQVYAILHRLCFVVTMPQEGEYTVIVPSFRATKDVTIAQDLIEEIARMYGFARITPTLPRLPLRPSDTRSVHTIRALKSYLAYGVGMFEQQNYAFYDESFLESIGWKETGGISLHNPLSENARRLVTSLLPHLCKNIIENKHESDSLRFFEIARVWGSGEGQEKRQLTAVWYEKRSTLTFYEVKMMLLPVFHLLGASITFVKADRHDEQWLDQSQAAHLLWNEKVVGHFGRFDRLMMNRMGLLPESTVFGLVLDIDTLLQASPTVSRYTALPKYPSSSFDISMLIPLSLTVAYWQEKLSQLDPLIKEVVLIDFFEKEEWSDARSVAFRLTLLHTERTLYKDEIEAVREKVIAYITQQGARLRA